MNEAQRHQWARRLEREAFGVSRPSLQVYVAHYDRWNTPVTLLTFASLTLLVFLIVTLGPLGLVAAGVGYLLVLLVAMQRARSSDVWGWYFFGYYGADRVDSVMPSATWRQLQTEAAQCHDAVLRGFATRRWSTYRAAFTALGEPFPDERAFRRGFWFFGPF